MLAGVGATVTEPEPVGAVIVRASDLVEVQATLREISEQNRAFRLDLRRDREAFETRYAEQDKRIGRLEKQMRWMGIGLLLAAVLGFASGWRWRGEVAHPPQIIYSPYPPPTAPP